MADPVIPLVAGRTCFGEDPAAYDRCRPDYPEALYQRLRQACDLGGARIFEVGPGTGTATRRLLRERPLSLTAIEPDPRLASYLASHAGADAARLHIINADFEATELPASAFDLGVSATAFHWLDQSAALAEAVAMLRPGGCWAMWWNIFGDPDDPDPFQQASDPLFRELEDSPSWPRDGRRPFSLDAKSRLSQMRDAGLVDLDYTLMRWTLSIDGAAMRRLAATFSQVALAAAPHRTRLLDQIQQLVDRTFGGRVERRFLTAFYLGRKPVQHGN